MTENSIDVNIVPVKNGMKRVVVSYYHYSRKEKDRMSSQTDYVWETKNEEMFKYFEARRTKVFYSQIRAMCVDSMARKMYVNTKSYDIKNDNQRVLFH